MSAIVWPAGDPHHRVPATLEWSFDVGATVRLVEPTNQWQLPFNSGHHVIHLAINEGEEYTLLDARVSGASADDRTTKLGAFTLALGAHTDNDECWPAAEYATANLTEWFGESGLAVDYSYNDHGPFLTLRYEKTTPRELEVDAGALSFRRVMDSPGAVYAADWFIKSSQVMHVLPSRPQPIGELERQFAHPLRAFTTFASDRPDSVTLERVVDTGSPREALIWRVARRTEVRPWRAATDYLFRMDDVEDFAQMMRAWWGLYEKVDPALGYFAQHINDGSTFSPERLVVLVAALEAYGDHQHGTTDLKALRNQTGIPSAATGCTNPSLRLIGISRGSYAHPSKGRGSRVASEAEQGIFPSIRRASALMQSCLLRDLGFTAERAAAMLDEHYRSWPIP